MKKVISFVLLISLILAITGCVTQDTGKNEDKNEETNKEIPKEQIGRMITHEDFLTEFTKRVDLNEYDLEFTDYNDVFDYNYTSKTDCEIEKSTENFQVEIDGIKVTLPLTIEEFVDLGFELISMNHADAPVNLSSVSRSALFNVKTPKGNTFSIYAISKNYTPVRLKNLIVMQISCDFYKGTTKYGKGERYDAPDITFFQNISGKSTVDSIIEELKTPRVIHFTQVLSNNKTTLVDLQLTFNFSNPTYSGDICITTHTILDESIEQTSYVSSLSYLIDYESIKNA